MSSLCNKQVLLGVSGGIAAYKSAELIRRLQDAGATVRVVMTPAAQHFITPLTLQALSGNPVHTEMLDPEAEAAMGHIELARWADLVLVAPASADFIARLTQGQGNDLLSTVCLATAAPIAIAPAMNQAMWSAASTQANISSLNERNISIFGPASGSQACGDVGPGRMLEPGEIASAAETLFSPGTLAGKTVVITAGPTREAIDPVRYISNQSSGKMCYAIAEAAIEAGARCILITGPTCLTPPEKAQTFKVTSALEMHEASLREAVHSDIFIASAAVADFRPAQNADQKLKKTASDTMSIELVKNPDIVAAVAALEDKPYTVGFAAETQNLENYAKDKLRRKNLDLIVANDVSRSDIGFNSDNNAVTIFGPERTNVIAECSKRQLARQLIDLIAQEMPSE